MQYSKSAFKRGYGQPYIVVQSVFLACVVLPLAIAWGWNATHSGTLPKVVATMFGIIEVVSLPLGLPISTALYFARKRRSKRQTQNIEEGILRVSLSIQAGWTASFAGIVHERKEYKVYNVHSFSETKRKFIVDGEIGFVHYYQDRYKPEQMTTQLKIPKVFDGEDQLRDYLNKAKGGV